MNLYVKYVIRIILVIKVYGNITYIKFGDEKLSEILTDSEMLKILFEFNKNLLDFY